MVVESKSFVASLLRDREPVPALSLKSETPARSRAAGLANWIQVGLVFTLIIVAVWTPQGRLNTVVSLLAVFFILLFTIRDGYSAQELGLSRPAAGATVMLGGGPLIVFALAVGGLLMANLGPSHPVPWSRSWQYAIWALQQQFILQSFFYLRLESLLGSRRAVLAATLLFASAHIPSPALTGMSFIGGLFFCEMFRRYRNIYPLGLIHAALGLVIAASFPDRWLHHMRVGLGYLLYHP